MPGLVRFACWVLLFFIGIQIISVTLPFLNAYPIYYLIGWGLFLASLWLAAFIINALRYAHWLQGVGFVSEEGEAVAPASRASLAFATTVLLVLMLLAVGSWYASTGFAIGECETELPMTERDRLYAWMLVIGLFAPLALLLLAVLLDALLPSVRRCAQIEFSVSEIPKDVLRKRAQLERIACYDEGLGRPVFADPKDGNIYTVEATRGLVRAFVGSVRIVVQESLPSKVAFLCTAQRGQVAHVSLELNRNSLLYHVDVRSSFRLDSLLVRLMGRKTYARYLALAEAKRIAQSGECEVRILSATPSC